MFGKIYDKAKKIIKENYKEIIFLLIIAFIANYRLNYSIMASGGTININDRVQVENGYESKGSFNLAYVTELRGTIPTVLLSYVIPSWTKVDLDEYKGASNESAKDIDNRSKVYLEYSIQSAIKLAYEKAGKTFSYTDYKIYVVLVDDKAETDLKIGDIISKVNDKKLISVDDYRNLVKNSEIGDIIKLTIQRNGKEKDVDIRVKDISGEKLTGVSILQLYDYKVEPDIDIKFKNSESGPSGGLMLALSIYDKLVSDDLTRGLKIVGTGTLDFEGMVGEIDGVEYKLKGAIKDKADVFIAPSGNNYEDCIRLKKENNYKIKIIEAKTFNQVLEELKKINS